MLTTQQAVALKAQVKDKLKQEEYRLALAKAIVEDVVTMQSAFKKFDLKQYNQTKGE
jgi:hypothetical protein